MTTPVPLDLWHEFERALCVVEERSMVDGNIRHLCVAGRLVLEASRTVSEVETKLPRTGK